MSRLVRNIAIIAHVDHGKTTLVDKLLRQSGVFRDNQPLVERVMDSNALERERGITIFSKNAAVSYQGVHINIIDTPGHADFGGEVERVLSMVDGVLLLVDAVEGPMPQTLFVTRKSLAYGLRPIVIINKCDRTSADVNRVINQTFELFCKLGATEEQLDFPVIYASALEGWAIDDLQQERSHMNAIFDCIIRYVPAPAGDETLPFQLQISALDYSPYVGRIGVGCVKRGTVHTGDTVALLAHPDATPIPVKITALYGFLGLRKVALQKAQAGDIVHVEGIEALSIGATLADAQQPEALPVTLVDEPTLRIQFMVNTSPLSGQEGTFVTSRQLRERLYRETLTDVSLRVEDTVEADVFDVSGRGELHLSILIENMRREGYELVIGRPRVITKIIDGVECEPYELLTLDIEESSQGVAMEALGKRHGQLVDMRNMGNQQRVQLEYCVSTRGLIGFYSEFVSMTRGTGLMGHIFSEYRAVEPFKVCTRSQGVLIAQETGKAVAYAIWKLRERGRFFIESGYAVYAGMIVGVHNRENDLVVNVLREKKLTNVRADGKDEHIHLIPPLPLTLEDSISFIQDDELVEITPKNIRLRKRYLTAEERRRHAK